MVFKVYSGRVGGIFGDLITVEVDSSPGLPALDMIGLLGSEVKEAKDRVRVSLKNNGINLPAMRITVNLSPADEHKNGSAFDLPIAMAILGVFGHLTEFKPEENLIIGELSLDGNVKPVKGILPIVRMAQNKGIKRVLLPRENAAEGAIIRGIDVIGIGSVGEAISYLNCPDEEKDLLIAPFEGRDYYAEEVDVPDFIEVVGQESAKRAASIAATGFHHLLMTGPPGTGKSLIAGRIPGIMPALSYEECLEISTIYSVAGKLNEELPFVKTRPFSSPHHGASSQAIVGGGAMASPGMVSLSHRGILFLDEMPEFKRETLDMLRQPLEDGKITVSRARKTYTYPAKFMLVGAMNPCPCGYYPDRNRCTCTENQISRYLSKISGPILDRIDICVEVARMDPKEIAGGIGTGMSSAEIRERVNDGVRRQESRYRNENFRFNSLVPTPLVNKYIALGEEETGFVYSVYESMNLSMRSFYKLIRVARSIADFDGDEGVNVKHLAEAACYRFPDYIERR